MTLTTDALDNTANLVNILEAGWTAANTDNKTPVIKRVYDIATPTMKDLHLQPWTLKKMKKKMMKLLE